MLTYGIPRPAFHDGVHINTVNRHRVSPEFIGLRNQYCVIVVVVVVVVVVVSHIQRIGCQPEKLLYTVADPARGLLEKEKILEEKVWQYLPP